MRFLLSTIALFAVGCRLPALGGPTAGLHPLACLQEGYVGVNKEGAYVLVDADGRVGQVVPGAGSSAVYVDVQDAGWRGVLWTNGTAPTAQRRIHDTWRYLGAFPTAASPWFARWSVPTGITGQVLAHQRGFQLWSGAASAKASGESDTAETAETVPEIAAWTGSSRLVAFSSRAAMVLTVSGQALANTSAWASDVPVIWHDLLVAGDEVRAAGVRHDKKPVWVVVGSDNTGTAVVGEQRAATAGWAGTDRVWAAEDGWLLHGETRLYASPKPVDRICSGASSLRVIAAGRSYTIEGGWR